MKSIIQIPPAEIKSILIKRLTASYELWKKRTPDDLEQEKVLYFKYYFDFSTAIEHCIRGILFEHSSHKELGQLIAQFIKPSAYHLSFFLSLDELSSIITEHKYSSIRENLKIDDYSDLMSFLPKSSLFHSLYDYEFFLEDYKTARNNRNILAHGVEAMDNGTFTSEFLMKYYLSFVVIHFCYDDIFCNNHDLDHIGTA